MKNARQPRVLVVDDDPDIRLIVGLNLGLMGIEFAEASNGSEAIELLEADDWDGCVLDIAMPQTDGFTVLKQMDPELFSTTAVVVLSAQGTPETAMKGLKMGAHTHLTKPFSPAAVAQMVKELMEIGAEEREARRQKMLERAGKLGRLGVPTV